MYVCVRACVCKYPSVPMTPGNFSRRKILGNSNRARSSCVPPPYHLPVRRWSGNDTCCDYIIIIVILLYAALYTHTLETACTKYYNIIMCVRAARRCMTYKIYTVDIHGSRQKRFRKAVHQNIRPKRSRTLCVDVERRVPPNYTTVNWIENQVFRWI